MAKSSSIPTIGFLVICLLLATFFSACSGSEGGKSGRDEEGLGERMPEKDLGAEDGNNKLGKDWGSRRGSPGRQWPAVPGGGEGSPGRHWPAVPGGGGGGWESGNDWGLGRDEQGIKHGGGNWESGKPEKDWGSGNPRKHYVGLGPGGEWDRESGGGWSGRSSPRGHYYQHGGGRRQYWGSEGGWSGRSSPCYIKYNHVPHGHDSWCCGSIQISISPMCWKSESQCTQACRPRRRYRHH